MCFCKGEDGSFCFFDKKFLEECSGIICCRSNYLLWGNDGIDSIYDSLDDCRKIIILS